MEWKSLSILVVICHLTASVDEGPTKGSQSSFGDGIISRRASIVMCHPEQTFFCINVTHYSPCVHIDFADLATTSFALSQGGEFFCGAERCCQVGGDSPCTYRCQPQPHEFKNPRISWNFAHMKNKVKKRSKEPLTEEDINRLNKIVSVKSFIIRQKDLEEWDDNYDEFDSNVYKWKPSYRTFCPLKQMLDKHPEVNTCATTPTHFGANTTFTREVTVPTRFTTTSTTTTRTTTTRATTTTSRTTTTTPTTRRTTTTRATTKPTTRTTTRRTTTRLTTTRSTTTKHTTKPTKPKKTKPPTTNKLSIQPSISCNSAIIHRKHNIVGTCQDYFQCIKTVRERYAWVRRSCPAHEHFDHKYQMCRKIEDVECRLIPNNHKQKKRKNDVYKQREANT